MDAAAQPLIDLTRSFLADELDASSYDEQFRKLFSRLPRVDEETFFALENLAVACDDYVEDPALRDGPHDLDEAGLRDAARRALARLGLA
ncbi:MULTISPECIES: colicin immunity domain-containing protein [unclassified Nocardioides]|uniref:colicin immunity domain-containing protein n=1 Tax=unclassified Nocardioides TaxID=2615069 RepID=UPI0036242A89